MKLLKALALGTAVLCASTAAHAGERYSFGTANAQITHSSARYLNSVGQRDFVCMALNVYHESRGQSRANQQAVAHVTENRHRLTGRSICSVVYERAGRRGAPQFSWTAHTKRSNLERDSWDLAQEIAWNVLYRDTRDITRGATHFHERKITPAWSRRGEHRQVIGAHVFLRLQRYVEVADAR